MTVVAWELTSIVGANSKNNDIIKLLMNKTVSYLVTPAVVVKVNYAES